MYDADTVLRTINDRAVWACACGALAFLSNWVYFFQCAKLGARDRCSPMALWATTVFIGHDGSFLIHPHHWFSDFNNTPGHWLLPLFWFGLIVTFTFELIFFSQTLRWGRIEYAPRLTQTQWILYCMGALAAGVVFWSITKSYLSDSIYLMTFLVTFGMCAPATIQSMVRRGDSSGTGKVQAWSYLLIGVFYMTLTVGVIGDPFRTAWWIAGCVVCVAAATTMLVLVYRMPASGTVFQGFGRSESDRVPASSAV